MPSARGVGRRAANGSRRAEWRRLLGAFGRTRAGPAFALANDAATRRFRPPAGWGRRRDSSRHSLVELPMDLSRSRPGPS